MLFQKKYEIENNKLLRFFHFGILGQIFTPSRLPNTGGFFLPGKSIRRYFREINGKLQAGVAISNKWK